MIHLAIYLITAASQNCVEDAEIIYAKTCKRCEDTQRMPVLQIYVLTEKSVPDSIQARLDTRTEPRPGPELPENAAMGLFSGFPRLQN